MARNNPAHWAARQTSPSFAAYGVTAETQHGAPGLGAADRCGKPPVQPPKLTTTLNTGDRQSAGDAFGRSSHGQLNRLELVGASHVHYIARMKTSTLPAVRVEPALRSDAEAVLDEGESLSDFVAACVRDGVTWRRTQDAFLARARDAVERSARENNGITPQELLRRMDDRLDAAHQRLAAGKPRAAR